MKDLKEQIRLRKQRVTQVRLMKLLSECSNTENCFNCFSKFIDQRDTEEILSQLESHFQLTPSYDIIDDLPKQTLETGGKMFIFLTFCPYESVKASNFMKALMKDYSPKTILLTLNRLSINNWLPGFLDNFMDVVRQKFKLKYKEIVKFTGQCEKDCNISDNNQLKDDPKVRILTNHPVHMGNLSQSALIPYCWFGYNLDMRNHTLPICASFKPVQKQHQICYEMDPSLNMTGMKKNDKESFLRKGLYLLLDENKDRQSKQQSSSSTSIFLDAIGMNSVFFIIF